MQFMAQSESTKAEQIISEFYLKSLQIVLDSRIPGLRNVDNGGSSSASSSRGKRRDKWFSLATGVCSTAAECMNMWYKNVGGPLIVDVIFVQDVESEGQVSSSSLGQLLNQKSMNISSSNADPLNPWGMRSYDIPTSRTSKQTVIERWILQCESFRGSSRDAPSSKGWTCGSNGKYENNTIKNRSSTLESEEGSMQMFTNSVDGYPALKRMYKRLTLSLRSLYSTSRLLPAYQLFRMLNSANKSNNFNLTYKVSSFCEPFSHREEETMQQFSFTPSETPFGQLSLSVTYRASLSDLNLENSTPMAAQIIVDYVGSPAADPLKIFPAASPSQSVERSSRATSFPLQQFTSPSSAPFQHPHSWTSGLSKASPYIQMSPFSPPINTPLLRPTFSDAATATATAASSSIHQNKPKSSNMITDSPAVSNSPPSRFQTNIGRASSFDSRSLSHKKGLNPDECWLSPPFSPSSSPSPPINSSGRHLLLSRKHLQSAPVSIPQSRAPRNSGYPTSSSSDSNRFPLPPLSPSLSKPDSFSHDDGSRASISNAMGIQGYSSESRSFRKVDSLKQGELYQDTLNLQTYPSPKVFKDSRDDSGRFSGLVSSSSSPRIEFSRSSSRVSFQDELDDYDFSCPFAVDDVDTTDSQIRSNDGKETPDPAAQVLVPAGKSQGAAVGMLVHMLRTAAPLRQDRSCYSQASNLILGSGVPNEIGESGFAVSRRTADALEELRSYKEMKDLLLSQSKTQLMDH